MKIHLILSVTLAAVALSGCPANTANNGSNAVAVNNSAPTGKTTNAANQAPKSAETEKTAKINFEGYWDSAEFDKKGNAYTQLTLSVKQTGDTISGTYSVVGFVDKEPQIEDGNQTPFTGTVKGNTATIKFDTEATVAGYEENVKYKEPAGGKPSTATLTLDGGNLQWKLTGGASPMDIPKEIVLHKTK